MQSETLRVSRLDMTTFVVVDLGWGMQSEAKDRFLHDRGRLGWVEGLVDSFAAARHGFATATRVRSAYSRAREPGRPTFHPDVESSLLPMSLEVQKSEQHVAGELCWWFSEVRVGASGALSIIVSARLADEKVPLAVSRLIESYHALRLDLRQKCPDLLVRFGRAWNGSLPRYAIDLTSAGLEQYRTHEDYYDVVDFDYVVEAGPLLPKQLYRSDRIAELRALAGLTRMSGVYPNYSEPSARALSALDFGNRDDELWVCNGERLVRHHPDHLKDLAKRLFWEDSKTAIEVLLMERATLNYLEWWVRQSRSQFLDALVDPNSDSKDALPKLRDFLRQLAWSGDLLSDPIEVGRRSGASFFSSLVARASEQIGTAQLQQSVNASIMNLLEVSTAIHAERSAHFAARSQEDGLGLAKASNRAAIAALIVGLASAVLALTQLLQGCSETLLIPGSADATPTATAVSTPSR